MHQPIPILNEDRKKYLDQLPIAQEVLNYFANVDDFDKKVLNIIGKTGNMEKIALFTIMPYRFTINDGEDFNIIQQVPIIYENKLTNEEILIAIGKKASIIIQKENSIFKGWEMKTSGIKSGDSVLLSDIWLIKPEEENSYTAKYCLLGISLVLVMGIMAKSFL